MDYVLEDRPLHISVLKTALFALFGISTNLHMQRCLWRFDAYAYVSQSIFSMLSIRIPQEVRAMKSD